MLRKSIRRLASTVCRATSPTTIEGLTARPEYRYSRPAHAEPTSGRSWLASVALHTVILSLCVLSPSPKAYAKQQKVLQLQIILTHPAEVNKLCNPGKPRNEWTNVNGCYFTQGPGRGKLIARQPGNWCDTEYLETLGHEVMHAMGMYHSPLFMPPLIDSHSGQACHFIYSDPRPQ